MTHHVAASREIYDGAIIDVRVDTVVMPDGDHADREVVTHDDSVAIVALDDRQRVLLLEQYRHPVAGELVEIPAGLCDAAGEEPLDTARRELREETGLTAERWTSLVSVHTSPGILTERAHLFLAEQVSEGDRSPDGAEERSMTTEWVALPDALAQVRSGVITDALAVAGLFAAADLLARR